MAHSIFNSIEIIGLATAIPKNRKKLVSGHSFRESNVFQTAADLGYEAAHYVLSVQNIDLNEIGTLIFVSKTPDYRGPATAAVLHGRLNISIDCIAYDVNIGSCGFIYGSQIVCSNLESTNKKYGLLIVGDTTTKQLKDNCCFGDGASAVLFKKDSTNKSIYLDTRTYSENYKSYVIDKGGFRNFKLKDDKSVFYDRTLNDNSLIIGDELFMKFANTKIPKLIEDFTNNNNIKEESLDLVALHQYNGDLIKLSSEFLNAKRITYYDEYANTCGNTIPLIISNYNLKSNTNKDKLSILACAFGEGFSVGMMSFDIQKNAIYNVLETDNYFEEGFITHD